MAAKLIVPGLWEVALGPVNVFLLESDDGLCLIDTGVAGSAGKIGEAVRGIGREPGQIRQILATHCHSDHAGSLAEMKRLTGAPAAMHAEDATLVRAGRTLRPMTPAPGPIGILGRLILRSAPTAIEAAEVEQEVADGEILPIAGGLRAIHVPGHCAGQLAFLWPRHGGVLFAADAAANAFGLGLSPMYEDLIEGKRSLAKLGGLAFEVACFGHGRPIRSGASARFRRKWAAA